MEKPKNLKGVQKLAGRIATLSRFISRMGEKALPFYQLLRKTDKFEWTPKADDAFEALKRLLSTSHVLVTPKERSAAIHRSYAPGGKHRTRGRTTRRWLDPWGPTPNLLPQRGTD